MLICVCDMTDYMCAMTRVVLDMNRVVLLCAFCLLFGVVCDMTRLSVRHVVSNCALSLLFGVDVCDMTRLQCDMTRSYV